MGDTRLGLPELTVDMDGVLCRPISWFNLVISRDIRHPPEFPVTRDDNIKPLSHRLASVSIGQALRYGWRPPLPRVREGLAELAELRRLVLLSGRPDGSRQATEVWLRRHRLRDFFSDIILNDRGLPNVSFKLLTTRERAGQEHVDDDGRVAYFLAKEGNRKVFLISYMGNAGLPYPPGVQRVRSLVDAARIIRTEGLAASNSG
jgi:hypothetical protein